MARDVTADLKVNDRTGAGLGSATRALDGFDKRVRKSSESTEKGLAASLKRTGDRLQRDASGIGGRIGGQMLSGTAQAITSGGPIVVGALAAVGALGASAISGAIIGGAGAGGVVGGAMIAARDARVQAEFDKMGERITSRLERSAQPFVPALIAVAQRGGDEFDRRLGGTLDRIFRDSVRYLNPLTDGILGLVEEGADGFADLVAAAQPVINVLRDDLPVLGRQLGDVLRTVAQDGETGARGLHVAFRLLGFTLQWTGATLHNLNMLFEKSIEYGRYLGAGPWLKLIGALDQTDAATTEVTASTIGFQRALDAETAAARTNIMTTAQLRDQNLSLAEAKTRLAEQTAQTSKAIRENGRATSDNTEKGRANNTALQQLARQINATQDAMERGTGATRQSVAAGQRARATFIEVARAAGYEAGQAERLANELLGIPRERSTKINVNNEVALRKARQTDIALDQAAASRTARINVSVRGISAARRAISEAGGATGFGAADGGLRLAGFAADNGAGYRSRVGGPRPLDVSSTVNVTIDGRAIEAMVDAKIDASERRQAVARSTAGRGY